MACESMYMNQNHPSTAMLGATYWSLSSGMTCAHGGVCIALWYDVWEPVHEQYTPSFVEEMEKIMSMDLFFPSNFGYGFFIAWVSKYSYTSQHCCL
jgi:hypothetical protein